MKDVFIPTQNFQKTQVVCEELLGPALGVEMAGIIGRAGRGKTTVAERIYANNASTVYVLYQEGWSHTELIREIAFRLCGERHRLRQACFQMIQDEFSVKRKIIMVDEADRMNLRCLNVLRNLHDICKVPILLIGEETLKINLAKERRLSSRIRTMITFEPVGQPDIMLFIKRALEQRITADQASILLKNSEGDFRKVLTAAVKAERIMKASGIDAITDKILREVTRED